MNYEIVELKEKKVVGVCARTSNEDPQMTEIIGSLWQKLYAPETVGAIGNRTNAYSIGLYSDYTEKDYQVTAGFEVSEFPASTTFGTVVIPAGRYAKFSIRGNAQQAVGECWQEIWATPLERTYTGDFEEYTSLEDVDIYIAIR